jgi:hypothetical protein
MSEAIVQSQPVKESSNSRQSASTSGAETVAQAEMPIGLKMAGIPRRSHLDTGLVTPGQVLRMQQVIGNRAVNRLPAIAGHHSKDRSIIQRDFNSLGTSGGNQPAVGPSTNPLAPGLGQNHAGTPGMAFGGAPALLGGNVDAAGVPYEVPGTDWKANVRPAPLPLDQAMPNANIPRPSKIPGWKAPIPPHENQLGPFKYNDPGDPNYIVWNHSEMIKSSWNYYIFHVCQDVESTWNSGVASINSFTQAAGGTGNEEIELLLKDMKAGSKWDLAANAKGKGSMADQANASSAKSTGGQGSAADIAKKVGDLTYVPSPQIDKTTDFTKSLQATGAAGGPVQEALQKAQTAHENYTQSIRDTATQAQLVVGAADTLKGAGLDMKAMELDEKKEDLEKQKKDIESGKAALAKINPQLAELYVDCKETYEKIEKVVEASKIKDVAKELGEENYLGAAREAATGALAVVKMEKIDALDKQIAAVVAEKKSVLDQSTVVKYEGAKNTFDAALSKLKDVAKAVDTKAREERNAMTDLAKAVEKNWKGNTGDAKKDAEQAKLAAGAIRALPIANKVLSLVQEVRNKVPTKLPEASGFNSDKAHTLATKGVDAPGDAELVTTASWILGIQPSIDNEVEKWQGIVGRLQLVVSNLGLKL